MKIVVTGAAGFLGWHLRLRLSALTDHEVVPVTRRNWSSLPGLVGDADAIIHLAGINRAKRDSDVEEGNIRLANDVSQAIASAGRPLRVVMAGTVQTKRDNPYGRGKLAAQEIIATATSASGGVFVDVCLPNLFGEHGKPRYNSFVATFVDAVIRGGVPEIRDSSVELLHAQDAAHALIAGLSQTETPLRPTGQDVGVKDVWELLQDFHTTYSPSGEFPDLSSEFRIQLFNTYRAALFPDHYPIVLVPHSDPRGSFVETIRSRGGEGQSSFSTTVSDVTRGEHYHLKKIERFAVVKGNARISLRKKFSSDVVDFYVTGEKPVAIDMPVGWVHNITNIGDEILLTQFWSHELFNPNDPDTFAESVRLNGKDFVQ